MSKVIFTGLYGIREGKRNEHVDDIPAKVRELLAKGVRIDVKGSASTVRPLLTELMSFPLPEEEETKMVKRYGLKITGGRKGFVSYKKAEDHYMHYYAWRPGAVLDIKEVEVKS